MLGQQKGTNKQSRKLKNNVYFTCACYFFISLYADKQLFHWYGGDYEQIRYFFPHSFFPPETIPLDVLKLWS